MLIQAYICDICHHEEKQHRHIWDSGISFLGFRETFSEKREGVVTGFMDWLLLLLVLCLLLETVCIFRVRSFVRRVLQLSSCRCGICPRRILRHRILQRRRYRIFPSNVCLGYLCPRSSRFQQSPTWHVCHHEYTTGIWSSTQTILHRFLRRFSAQSPADSQHQSLALPQLRQELRKVKSCQQLRMLKRVPLLEQVFLKSLVLRLPVLFITSVECSARGLRLLLGIVKSVFLSNKETTSPVVRIFVSLAFFPCKSN